MARDCFGDRRATTMPGSEAVQRVRIYLSESDAVEGQPLYLAALDRLRSAGATGATALRGIAGFGAGQRVRPAAAALSAAPIVIEWVDRADRVARALPMLDDLLPEALITVEDLRVYRAALRSSGPFGDRTVAGVFAAGDLVRRGGMRLPFRLLGALDDEERRLALDELPPRTLADALTRDPRTVYVEASIPQAISPLVEWGLDALPVVDRSGRLVGIFGVEQALRAARRPPAEAGPVRDTDPPTPVSLVMQRTVPTIAADAPLPELLAQLLAAPGRFLVVLDGARPVGPLNDVALAQRLVEPLRSAWLAALRAPDAPLPPLVETSDYAATAGDLAGRDLPAIGERATEEE